MCLYEKRVLNPKYTKNKKNQGQVPLVPDERVRYIPVGCGKCIECRKEKQREWQVRLQEDIKENTNGKFIVLTFSNESIAKIHEQHTIKTDTEGKRVKVPIRELEGYEIDNAIATRAMRLFLERWRKEYKTSVRHWLITELGHNGTENVHMHGIIWTNETYETIRDMWNYGYIWPRPEHKRKTWVNAQSVNYMTKYVSKIDKQHKEYRPIILTSSGIGGNYTKGKTWKENIYNGTETNETYRTSTGHKIALPKYYKNKIYNDWQKELLWLQKLEKQEKWVRGERIDISQNEEAYKRALEWHRRINRELGYGSNEKDYEKEHYEKQRRNIIIKNRIENAK